MKKRTGKELILLLLLLPLISYSQVRFGLRGAVHSSNISGIHTESESRIAGSIGGFVQIPLGRDNQFFFQPEISYSLQGERDKRNKYNNNVDTQFFQNYIIVPLMFRAYFSENDTEFFGELGPQISLLINQKNKELDLSQYYDEPDSMDFSIGLGIGFSVLRKYEFSIRYNYGVTDVYKKYPGPERTSVLGINFAYIFN